MTKKSQNLATKDWVKIHISKQTGGFVPRWCFVLVISLITFIIGGACYLGLDLIHTIQYDISSLREIVMKILSSGIFKL